MTETHQILTNATVIALGRYQDGHVLLEQSILHLSAQKFAEIESKLPLNNVMTTTPFL